MALALVVEWALEPAGEELQELQFSKFLYQKFPSSAIHAMSPYVNLCESM